MATVENPLEIYLAETGDAQAAFTNSTLRIYNAAYAAELSRHTITVTPNGTGTLTLTPAASNVLAAIVAQTAALARIYHSDGTSMLIGALTVGVTGVSGDIRFNVVTSWDTGDNVAPGAITFDMTGLTVTVA